MLCPSRSQLRSRDCRSLQDQDLVAFEEIRTKLITCNVLATLLESQYNILGKVFARGHAQNMVLSILVILSTDEMKFTAHASFHNLYDRPKKKTRREIPFETILH